MQAFPHIHGGFCSTTMPRIWRLEPYVNSSLCTHYLHFPLAALEAWMFLAQEYASFIEEDNMQESSQHATGRRLNNVSRKQDNSCLLFS